MLSLIGLISFATCAEAGSYMINNLAQSIADWTTVGYWGWGEEEGVYKRSSGPVSIEGGRVVVPTTSTVIGNVTRHVYERNPSKRRRSDGPLEYAEQFVEDGGGIINTTLRFQGGTPRNIKGGRSNSNSERADWSVMNFQYWSEDGNRYTDATHQEMYDDYSSLFTNAAGLQKATGFCAAIIDDYSYWATVRMWTGTNGYGLLGCECESSDYPNVLSCPSNEV